MRSQHTAAEYRAFTAKLVAARKSRGLTQLAVAKALGVPQSRISDMETGQRRVDAVELRQFATLYRKRLDWFV